MKRSRSDSRLSHAGQALLAGELISGLKANELRQLLAIIEMRHFKPGEMIMAPASVPVEVMVFKTGKADLVTGKGLKTVRSVVAGEVLGFTQAIARAPTVAGLRADTDCDLIAINSQKLEEYLRHAPEACYRSALAIASNLQEALHQLASHTP
jgi:CRP-like cAMP-binding protein